MKIFLIASLLLSVAQAAQPEGPALTQEDADRLNATLEKAHELSAPYIFLADVQHKKADREKLEQAIQLYDEVLARVPDHWVSLFLKGKAFQALADHEGAYQSFKLAYQYQGDHKDVLNEYAIEAIELGYFEEALANLERGQEKFPTDLGVRGNYALALLMNGRVDDALVALYAVQKQWPDDKITNLMIPAALQIQAGKAPQPENVQDLHRILDQIKG